MLVLSRKVGQSLVIGNDIKITVVRMGQGGVRIGIEAPDGMKVLREEVIAAAPYVPASAKTSNAYCDHKNMSKDSMLCLNCGKTLRAIEVERQERRG